MPPHGAQDAQTGRAAPADLEADQARLIAALACPAVFGPDCVRVERLETHISYVLLTGQYAFKIKKAVAFGFLDFTALAARRRFCGEEVRLNRRLAPALYLDSVPITGSIDAPVVGGEGVALEYAVKMREFPQEALASRILARGELSASDVDALARKVAAFHGSIESASRGGAFGSPEEILRIARQNLAQIDDLLHTAAERDEIERLRAWTEREHEARHAAFLRRRADGFIRECHGDLHLGNIARVDGELTIFDCIEFNEGMRWIDVMSEIAFTVMDLRDRGRSDLAQRFLDRYLETTGDYSGLEVLRFYLVYRALVRAKIARLRANQLESGDAQNALLGEYRGYVALAGRYAQPPRRAVVITHGLAGSGKTTASQTLLETIGGVRIRSDVERKRMHGLTALDRSGAASDLYAPAATEATYGRLRTLAQQIVSAGWTAIVDATFLHRSQREPFRALAAKLEVPFIIVDFRANEETLCRRVARRHAGGSDASDADVAVLMHQIAAREPLAADEERYAIAYDAEAALDGDSTAEAWARVRARLSYR